ncbi:MAG: hypothetical protein WC028_27725 [Candidatus Obscuribacterales bacterium]
MKTNTSIIGGELEESSIESASANASIDAKIKSFSIEQILGKVTLRSKLVNGKITISLTPHFDWGTSFTQSVDTLTDSLTTKLEKEGFSKEDIKKINSVLQTETPDFEFGELEEVSSSATVGDEITPVIRETTAGITLPLPNIPINLDPEIDVKNLSINDIAVGGSTVLTANLIHTQPAKLRDFDFVTDIPDIIAYSSAEVNNARLRPIEIPQLGLPDLQTTLSLPKLGAEEMKFEVDSKSGGADVTVTPVNRKKLWRKTICVRFFGIKKCLWIEFGVSFRIDVHYDWQLETLKVALTIKNAFLNQIDIAIKISKAALSKIKVGLLKLKQIKSEVK